MSEREVTSGSENLTSPTDEADRALVEIRRLVAAYGVACHNRSGDGTEYDTLMAAVERLQSELGSMAGELAASEARRKELETRQPAYDRLIEDWKGECDRLRLESETLRGEATRLRGALEKYGEHNAQCAVYDFGNNVTADAERCTCGLTQIKAHL